MAHDAPLRRLGGMENQGVNTMTSRERPDQVFGGVFLIGLAVLFITNWWWPGIMFALGVALLAKTLSEGKALTDNPGALVVLTIGLIFTVGDVFSLFGAVNWLPLVLIAVGLYLLFGDRLRGGAGSSSSVTPRRSDAEKDKNGMV